MDPDLLPQLRNLPKQHRPLRQLEARAVSLVSAPPAAQQPSHTEAQVSVHFLLHEYEAERQLKDVF